MWEGAVVQGAVVLVVVSSLAGVMYTSTVTMKYQTFFLELTGESLRSVALLKN